MLQETEATPGAPKGVPWPPWWALFWPYRVHLADVKVDEANILWKLQDKESGIYKTRLEVTPNGHDFEYDANGGDFKNADHAAAPGGSCPHADSQTEALLFGVRRQ